MMLNVTRRRVGTVYVGTGEDQGPTCGFIQCIHYHRKVDVLGAIRWMHPLYRSKTGQTLVKHWSYTGQPTIALIQAREL
jgi:hypothetical protein